MSEIRADWMEIGDAVALVVDAMAVLDSDIAPLRGARGRVLSEDVVSPIDLPLWTNSAMDGFAVRAADVVGASAEAPVSLPVVEEIPAGGFPSAPLAPGTAVKIMTGAPVPEGADSVIRIEHTDGGSTGAGGAARVEIRDDQDAGRNLRVRGEDLTRDAVALARGTILTPGAIGVAASLGREHLSVVRRPRVALLTSGDELVEVERFEEVLAGRKIVSSSSYALAAALEEAGCEVRDLGIAADTPASVRAALAGAEGCDALITTAGVSVGAHDHIKSVLLAMDAEVRFWRVRIRPGSPFAFGRVGSLSGIPWFGLPGNPVSSLVTFELFARPALLRMAGRRAVFRRALAATLRDGYPVPPGLTHLVRVRLEREGAGSGWNAHLTGAQGSGILGSVARADGLMVIPADRPGGRPGDVFPVIVLEGADLSPDRGY